MNDKQQCCELIVRYGNLSRYEHQCPRAGTYEHDGKLYCKQHHPPTVKVRRDKANDVYTAKNAVTMAAWRIERAAPDLLAVCKIMVNDVGWTQHSPTRKALLAAIAKAEGTDD